MRSRGMAAFTAFLEIVRAFLQTADNGKKHGAVPAHQAGSACHIYSCPVVRLTRLFGSAPCSAIFADQVAFLMTITCRPPSPLRFQRGGASLNRGG